MSAFNEALTALKKGSQAMASSSRGFAKGAILSALEQARKMVTQSQKGPIKQDRRGKQTRAIASLQGNGVLYSDGTAKYPPRPTGEFAGPLDQQKAQILKRNVMDQVSWSPEAKKLINDLDFFAYGTRNQSSEYNQSGGKQFGNKVGVNVNSLDAGGIWPGTVGLHESLHAVDDSIVGSSRTGARSKNMDELLSRYEPKARAAIRKIMKGSGLYADDRRTRDVEGFAYAGDKGPRTVEKYNKPVKSQYDTVFLPASRNVSYSPQYPIKDIYEDMISMMNLGDEDE